MNPEPIIYVASAALALVFEYAPRLREWYERQAEGIKRRVMLAVIAVTVAATYGLSCGGYIDAVACGSAWDQVAFDALRVFVLAAAANQGVHRLTKRQEPEVAQ